MYIYINIFLYLLNECVCELSNMISELSYHDNAVVTREKWFASYNKITLCFN